MPKVSVIMPSYNSALYLKQAINSILKQSYQDFELLIVDDGSTDESVEIIKKFVQQDARIRLFLTENIGSGGARNKGIDNARGDYYYFIDSDDFYDPDFLEKTMQKIQQGYDCVICNYRRVSGKLATTYNVKPTPLGCYCAVWSKAYSKRCWNHLRFPESFKVEDFEVVPIAVARASKVGYVDNTYYNYRIHSNSITHNIDVNESFETIRAIRLLFANQAKFNITFNQKELRKYTNDFLYTHLYTIISKTRDFNQRRNAYRVLANYGKKMNSRYFATNAVIYNDNKFKQLRNNILIFLFSLNLFGIGIAFAKALSKLFGKRGIK